MARDIKLQIAKRIRQLRKEHGYSQQELAGKAGIDYKHLQRLEGKFIKDLMTGSEPELKKYIEEENKKSLNEIKRIFLEAQKNGEIRSDIKIDFIIYMMNIMREVFKDENLQKLYPDFTSLMKDAFNFFYYGVLKK